MQEDRIRINPATVASLVSKVSKMSQQDQLYTLNAMIIMLFNQNAKNIDLKEKNNVTNNN